MTTRIFPSQIVVAAVVAFSVRGGIASATINAGTTVVTSIGHNVAEAYVMFPPPMYSVVDYIIEQGQQFGGGGVLPNVNLDLDSDTSISYTISAPSRSHFAVYRPPEFQPRFRIDMGWIEEGALDNGGIVPLTIVFQNLIGIAPNFSNSSTLGDENRFLLFDASSNALSTSLSFTSLTMTLIYSERNLGGGSREYIPYGTAPAIGGNGVPGPLLNVSYRTTSAADPGNLVQILPGAIPGDANGDGVVNAQDLAVLGGTWLHTGLGLAADSNSDRVVNSQDLAIIAGHWLQHDNGPGPSAAAAVPEPSTFALAALGGLALLALRRRVR